jgi:K+-sensing histidine kinase KdpD
MYTHGSVMHETGDTGNSVESRGAPVAQSPLPLPVDTVRALFHDMRQPLTALRLMAGDPRRHVDDVGMANFVEQVDWLTTLVESVLGSSADSGPVDVDLGELVRHATLVAFTATGCRASVEVGGAIRVQVRTAALERAVLCLLDNAIRAAGDDGHVQVEVREHHGFGCVVIRDDGPGLGRLAPQHSLGLTTVRAVLADCGGSCCLRNGDHGGAVAIMDVPLAGSTVLW